MLICCHSLISNGDEMKNEKKTEVGRTQMRVHAFDTTQRWGNENHKRGGKEVTRLKEKEKLSETE
ncbi:putative late blight resistance protein-like protein R1A-10, partial [Sesbania bispinosa]